MARDEGRPLATSSLAVGRLAAKQNSLRSARGRLVASLNETVLVGTLLWRMVYAGSLDSKIRDFASKRLYSLGLKMRFFTKIQDQIKKNNPIIRIFR